MFWKKGGTLVALVGGKGGGGTQEREMGREGFADQDSWGKGTADIKLMMWGKTHRGKEKCGGAADQKAP